MSSSSADAYLTEYGDEMGSSKIIALRTGPPSRFRVSLAGQMKLMTLCYVGTQEAIRDRWRDGWAKPSSKQACEGRVYVENVKEFIVLSGSLPSLDYREQTAMDLFLASPHLTT